MEWLPPLGQFQAFEAAARHRSFSRAAQELNVQQPAISRQIANIENLLEVRLFVRTKAVLTLTEEGEILYSAVSDGLAAIRSAANDIRKSSRKSVITINAAIGFTSLYLLPRMAEFQDLYPHVSLEIVTRDQNPDYDVNQCDCVIIFGTSGIRGLQSRMVLAEELIPVCAPGFLAGNSTQSKESLTEFPLLHMSSNDHRDDWQLYFAGSGVRVPEPDSLKRILSYMVYVRAIQNGDGIGLGWGGVTDDLIASGTLVPACNDKIRTNRGYHCCITRRGESNPATRTFLDWLASRADKSD